MLPLLSPAQWLTLHTAAALLALFTYTGVTLAGRQRRSPSAAIAWVLFLAVLPYFGLPLFLVFGPRKIVRAPRKARIPLHDAIQFTAGPGARTRALARSMGLPEALPCEALVIHQDGTQALTRLRALVQSAQRTLEVSTFLMGRDALGDEMAALLEERARQGVRVRLMIDGAGRFLGGVRSFRSLRRAGVEVVLFAPPWSSPLGGRINLRNHRKVAIADGQWLWTGGRNLAAEYFVGAPTMDRQAAPWIDLTFDLRGAVAAQARHQFESDWAFAVSSGDKSAPPIGPAVRDSGSAGSLAQFLPSGPDHADDTLYELLLDGCFGASRRIIAVTPYFVPDAALLMALTLAARRGVSVDLVLPQRSNHRLADLARPDAVRDLVESGASVWLAGSMVHGKLVVIDDTVALAGSLNLDSRSLFLNYEMMVAFYDAHAIGEFASWAHAIRSGAQHVQLQPVNPMREVAEGLLRWLTFQL